jgi:large subunit ribosomal protein L30
MQKDNMEQVKRLRLTLKKSAIGYPQRQKATIKALGLQRLGSVVEHENSPAIRGMVAKIVHLIEWEEIEG